MIRDGEQLRKGEKEKGTQRLNVDEHKSESMDRYQFLTLPRDRKDIQNEREKKKNQERPRRRVSFMWAGRGRGFVKMSASMSWVEIDK
jgi:hypothetical protein